MDPKEALEQLKEIDDVPEEVIEALEGSPLRKQLSDWEARWREEAEPAISFKAKQETLPKRKEALKRVGVDYDAQAKYGQKTLDAIPSDKLDDLEFVAAFVKDEGFEANLQPEEQTREKSGAEQVTDFLTSTGTGAPVRSGKEAEDEAFYAELDKVPDGDKQAIRAVLEKHNRLVSDQG